MEKSVSMKFRLKSRRQSSMADLCKLDLSDADVVVPVAVKEEAVFEFADGSSDGVVEDGDADDVPMGIKLMYAANEGDLEGVKELLDSRTDVNYRDIDERTPLHIAACQGYREVVELLVENGADIDAKDRWGSTPIADAIYYKNHEVIKVLEKHGAVAPNQMMTPMNVKDLYDIPEYEIDPREIDFTNSTIITKGTFRKASWRGIEVAVKQVGDDVFTDEDKVRAFRDELALLQRVRHPNVVQFLGAVTQSTPMMIVTEYLPKGDLCQYLNARGQLKPIIAVKFALDIARGVSYLHENKPEPIIHRDLEPANILRDDSGNLKVADLGVSKLLKAAKGVEEDKPTWGNTTCRYMAPELFENKGYDTKVDVFSFGLILQEVGCRKLAYRKAPHQHLLSWGSHRPQPLIFRDRGMVGCYPSLLRPCYERDILSKMMMIEGSIPFPDKDETEVPKAYAKNKRPPFRASGKLYAHGLRELIEDCWNQNPTKRPTFREIIVRLNHVYNSIGRKRHWTVGPLRCFHRSSSSLGSFSQENLSP